MATYIIVLGQAKQDLVTTRSQTDSVDGSLTITDPSTVDYDYDPGTGLLTAATQLAESHSTTTDSFGNVSQSWTAVTYIIVAGQAKQDLVTTRSHTDSVDGSVTITDPSTIQYIYYADTPENRSRRRVGHLSSATQLADSHSTTTDSFGNISQSWSMAMANHSIPFSRSS